MASMGGRQGGSGGGAVAWLSRPAVPPSERLIVRARALIGVISKGFPAEDGDPPLWHMVGLYTLPSAPRLKNISPQPPEELQGAKNTG